MDSGLRSWRVFCVGAALALALSGCASLPARGRVVVAGAPAPMPSGYLDYCLRTPGECARPAAGVDRVRLNEALWTELEDINLNVNLTIEPVEDIDLYGVPERWAYPVLAGDCEDYVLAKRKALLKRGWPATALHIAVVHSALTGRHAVLVVATDRGDFVLDNAVSWVEAVADSPYTWLTMQDAADPLMWRAVVAQSDAIPAPQIAAAGGMRRIALAEDAHGNPAFTITAGGENAGGTSVAAIEPEMDAEIQTNLAGPVASADTNAPQADQFN